MRAVVVFLALALILLTGCSARDPVGCAALTVLSLPFAGMGSEPGNFESCSTPGHPLPEAR